MLSACQKLRCRDGIAFHGEQTEHKNGQIPTDSTALRARALGGAAANLIAQVVKVAIQFVSAIVLARLLPPADFGVFGMVMPVTAFILIFQDLGLAQAVVGSAALTYGQLNSLFWINLTLSLLLGAALAGIAPVIAQFYKDERVFDLTLALAGTVPISGLMTQHFALFGRQMRFTWLAVLDVISLISGFLAAISVASVSPNYWALFASFVVTMLRSSLGFVAVGRLVARVGRLLGAK